MGDLISGLISLISGLIGLLIGLIGQFIGLIGPYKSVIAFVILSDLYQTKQDVIRFLVHSPMA